MKTIPQIREALYILAEDIGGNYERRIKLLTRQLKRRSPVRKARRECASMTPQIAAMIRKVARQNPGMSYISLAKLLPVRVATGRISEVLAGKREAA